MSAPARWKRSAVLAVLLGACGPHPDPGTNHGSTASTPSDFAVEHDFGPIAHGDDATADLRIPVPSTGGPWVPMGFIRSCTCAQHEFLLEEPDGHTRAVTRLGIADPAFAVPADGALILRLTIRTAEKEVADLAPTWTPAQVVLQSTAAGSSRATIPLRFRFGIEAPYRLRPFGTSTAVRGRDRSVSSSRSRSVRGTARHRADWARRAAWRPSTASRCARRGTSRSG
ncbi:MAG: hypothetical protein ACO4CT_10840 [Planctomycetota bacterium]